MFVAIKITGFINQATAKVAAWFFEPGGSTHFEGVLEAERASTTMSLFAVDGDPSVVKLMLLSLE